VRGSSALEVIDRSGEEPEREGRCVDPELVEGYRPVVTGVNDCGVLERDEDPAVENEAFGAGIACARAGGARVDFEDEGCVRTRWRGWARDEAC